MKVLGLIRRQGEKTGAPKTYNLKVEAVLNPVNSYLVGFHENLTTNDAHKEKYSEFEYRNIISIIYGTISDIGLCFDVQVVVYSDGSELLNQVIHSECYDNENYVFDYVNYDCIGGEKYIFNMSDISTLPEFKDKTVVECIQRFMEIKESCDHRLLFDFYKVASKKELLSCSEFLDYTDNKS